MTGTTFGYFGSATNEDQNYDNVIRHSIRFS